jgi:autotransporter-associated beta strand protein
MSARANDFNWAPTSGNDFSTDVNWLETAVPGTGDIVFDNDFGNPGNALMSITTDQTVNAMRINNGNTVEQTGGTLTISNDPAGGDGATDFARGIWVGEYGNGTYNMSGGSIVIEDDFDGLILGKAGDGDEGWFYLSDGSITTASDTFIGLNGKGTWTQTGGTFTGQNIIMAAGTTSAYSRVNLEGGTLSVKSVAKWGGNGTNFFFNGGTLQALVSTTAFMQGLDNVRVRDNGAIIDTNGNDVTIGQELGHSDQGGDNATDGGLTKIGSGTLTLSGANSYNGGTNINDGTLQFAQTNAMPASGTVTTGDGATLAVNVGGAGEFTNASGNGSIDALLSGTGGQAAPVTFDSGAALGFDTTNASGDTFAYSSVIADTNAGANVLGITKLGSGTLVLSGSNTYTGATIVIGGTFQLGATLTSSTSVSVADGAALKLTGSGIGLVTSSLAVSGTGYVDIVNNVLAVHGASAGTPTGGVYDGITGLVQSGLNASGGYWNGAGINSSTAAGDGSFITGIGVVDNSVALYTSIGGLSGLTSDEILVRYTYNGDANLDGAVTGADYGAIDTGFGLGSSGWANGDFNYDGVVTGADYGLIDTAFGLQGAPLATGGGPASVPEPTSFALLLAGAAGMLELRRRRA